MRVLVLDTSALIMGLDPLGLKINSYSVPEVTEELRTQTGPSYRLTFSSSSGKLKIQSPSSRSLDKVSQKASQLGDRIVLSKADASVLALALDLREEGKDPVVVSDDYAVQNVADGVGLPYQSLANLGIRHRYAWIYYCPACFKRYANDRAAECQICGTKLRRKPVRKEAAGKSSRVDI